MPLATDIADRGSGGTSAWRTLGWALYLACSWTWCIGMFLPVLLVRDYGVWGFVVFAVPNVVGAAAMGWVIADRGRVRGLIERHAVAMRAFSWVTMLFHVVFLAMLGELFGLSTAVLLAVPVVVMVGWLSARWSAVMTLRLALGLYLISVLMFMWTGGVFDRFIGWPLSESVGGHAAGSLTFAERLGAITSGHGGSKLIWMAPICVLGFALCPYLDLTFLKARSELNVRDSRLAFTLGFGVFFAAMIVGTLYYASFMSGRRSLGGVGWALGVHVLAQALFTLFVHARQCAWIGPEFGTAKPPRGREVGIVVTTAIVGMLVTVTLGGSIGSWDMDAREVAYRYFMSFYGLVFPTYVWLCMIPTVDGHSGIAGPQGRRKVIVFFATVVLAAPFFWLGFIMAQEHWLGVGLGVVLVSRLVVRRR